MSTPSAPDSDLVEVVGAATVTLLELLERAGALDAALDDEDVRRLLDLLGLEPTPEIPVTISPRPRPRCEICGAGLDAEPEHSHVADVVDRRLLCACRSCHLLLRDQADGRFRAVPDEPPRLVLRQASAPPWWDRWQLPVGVVFVVRTTDPDRTVACFPGPAGVVESDLTLDQIPAELVPSTDTETLLVRSDEHGFEAWIAPVTAAYELSGELRSCTGLGALSDATRQFFAALASRASRASRASSPATPGR